MTTHVHWCLYVNAAWYSRIFSFAYCVFFFFISIFCVLVVCRGNNTPCLYLWYVCVCIRVIVSWSWNENENSLGEFYIWCYVYIVNLQSRWFRCMLPHKHIIKYAQRGEFQKLKVGKKTKDVKESFGFSVSRNSLLVRQLLNRKTCETQRDALSQNRLKNGLFFIVILR